jgi:predicted transcriptional regulator
VALEIGVEKTGELKFRVRLAESGSETAHDVTVSASDYAKFTAGKIEPEELVRKSFEFLLEREPKESILTRFDLSVISRYFPEYEREIKRSLSNSK